MTKKEVSEARNVLVESARLVRGKIQELSELEVDDFDALILPGGFGAATNLSDIGLKNENGEVIKDLKEIITRFHKLSKPIGAICISPTILISALKEQAKIKVTLGEKNEIINKMGAIEETCPVYDVVIDEENKLITTPAFMQEASLTQIHKGISKLVTTIIKMSAKNLPRTHRPCFEVS